MQLDRIDVSVEQVRSTFKHLNQSEATGSNNLSTFILKTAVPVCQPIFQYFVDTHIIPEIWKTSHIIPPPK